LIVSLDNSNAAALSYKTIVEGNDAEDTMSEHKKEGIQMKVRYLAQAYRIAIEEMPLADDLRQTSEHVSLFHFYLLHIIRRKRDAVVSSSSSSRSEKFWKYDTSFQINFCLFICQRIIV
jgi:hypothetical protein